MWVSKKIDPEKKDQIATKKDQMARSYLFCDSSISTIDNLCEEAVPLQKGCNFRSCSLQNELWSKPNNAAIWSNLRSRITTNGLVTNILVTTNCPVPRSQFSWRFYLSVVSHFQVLTGLAFCRSTPPFRRNPAWPRRFVITARVANAKAEFRGELYIYIFFYVGQKSCIKILNLGYRNPHFSFSLCGGTQGNPAKHKLGARFAQGGRKCFHAPYHIFRYICKSLQKVFRFGQLASHCSFGILYGWRSSGFRICQSSRSKTEKLSCISRASKKMHLGEAKKGAPEQMITSLERKLAKYQRNLSTQWRWKGRQRIAVKERQGKARSDVTSRSSSSTSSSDSSDWKSPCKCTVAGKLKP